MSVYNPPAFPRPYSTDNYANKHISVDAQEGMLMRDYFAANAICGIISHEQPGAINTSAAAQLAYQVADSMLAAR